MENAEFIRYALKDDSGMIAGMMGMHAQFTISNRNDGVGGQQTGWRSLSMLQRESKICITV